MDDAHAMQAGGWTVDILQQGYPGKTVAHGGLGWSTIALLRGHGRVAVLDTGGFGARRSILGALARLGLGPGDVTDLLLSHVHYDHVMNWPMFGDARIVVGAAELAWGMAEPPGNPLVPELYVERLARHPRLVRVDEGQPVLPGITAHLVPGHTPGHLMFVVDGGADADILLVQDAAKYRSELITRQADMTHDAGLTAASIGRIWAFWAGKPGTLVIPGHDLPMVLVDGVPTRRGGHRAGITALFGATLHERTEFDLAQAATSPEGA